MFAMNGERPSPGRNCRLEVSVETRSSWSSALRALRKSPMPGNLLGRPGKEYRFEPPRSRSAAMVE